MAFIAGGMDSGDSFIDGFVKAWTPTIAADFMDVYHWDQDFLGRRISNQTDWNKLEPEWQRAAEDTPQWAVDLSRVWSEATGGSDHRRSKFDSEYLNPSDLYYLLEQQVGGMGTLVTKISNLVEQMEDPDTDVEPRNVPFVSKFYIGTGDDYSKNRVVNEKFWMYWNEYKALDHERDMIISDLKNGKITKEESEKKLDLMKESGDKDKWLMMRKHEELYDHLLKQSRKGDEEAKKKLIELKRKIVEEKEKTSEESSE